MTEAQILQQVRQRLGKRPDVLLCRYNGAAISLSAGRFFRACSVNGTPDLVGILTVCGMGVYLGIEVKTPKGRQSADQKRFEAAVKAHGGVYLIATSADEAETLVQRAADRIRSARQGYHVEE